MADGEIRKNMRAAFGVVTHCADVYALPANGV
jgi:hypothetical protein